MDYIQFVNSKDIRNYLYYIDYKLSVDQMIFVVLRCIFISIEKKIDALQKIKDSKCILSKNLEVMELEVNPAESADNKELLDFVYDTVKLISLPMPFKKGDIVKAKCPPYLFGFRANDNCVFIGYRPHCAEDLRPHRDGGDILFFAYLASNYGFSQSDGDPFSYELEYATLDPKKYKDQKLILLSDFIKGKLGPNVFYSAIRYLESKENMADEKDYFCSWGVDSEYEFLKESFNHK